MLERNFLPVKDLAHYDFAQTYTVSHNYFVCFLGPLRNREDILHQGSTTLLAGLLRRSIVATPTFQQQPRLVMMVYEGLSVCG
jgi:hypothetical protein